MDKMWKKEEIDVVGVANVSLRESLERGRRWVGVEEEGRKEQDVGGKSHWLRTRVNTHHGGEDVN